MKKTLMKKDIQDYDIFLSCTKFKLNDPSSWIAPIIRWVTGFKFNHVGIILKIKGTLMIVESTEKGFNVTKTLDQFIIETDKLGLREVIILRDSKLEDNKQFIDYRLSLLLANNYDFSSLIYKHIIYKLSGIWLNENKEKELDDINRISSEKITCSEAIAALWKNYFFLNWYRATPKDILTNKYFNIV